MRFLMPVLAAALFMTATPAFAESEAMVGEPTPDFTATDIEGNTVSLSDFEGQPVVLEWTNHLCPFVVKHYDSGNMQDTQKQAMEEYGAAWITIVSSSPGKQGHVSADEAATIMEDAGAHVSAKILDENGEIGKTYGARTTPHMYVVDSDGILVYAGAIDSIPSHDQADIEGAENYVLSALDDLEQGEPVATPQSKPYGCSVKY